MTDDGVEVVTWVEDDDDDAFAPAARHAQRKAGPLRRVVTAGTEALAGSAEAIAAEVDLVAERMISTLERRRGERAAERSAAGVPEPAREVDEVEMTFGVTLTGGASVRVFTGTGEASAQITLRFSLRDP